MFQTVGFGGGAENTDAEAKGSEIRLPEEEAGWRFQRMNVSERRKEAPAGGLDEALLAGPEAGEEQIGILGGKDERLFLRAEAAAQERVAHIPSAFQVQADGTV